ncbi:MAG: hypothetical protein AB8G77_06100 [Rhodothermales bacterium]
MKTAKYYFFLVLLVFLVTGCSSNALEQVDEIDFSEEEVIERLSDVQAVVSIEMNDVLLLKVDKGNYYKTYQTASGDVKKAFWIDGLSVIFSGNAFAIPPTVRMHGQPVDVTDIRIGR